MKPLPWAPLKSAIGGSALALFISVQPASAITVNLTAADVGAGVFHYEISVSNDETVDLAIVSLVDAPMGDALIGVTLSGPAGFLTSYDAGLGSIDLLENTSPFLVGTTTSGFSFDSMFGPTGYFTAFEALNILGELITGDLNVTSVERVPETGSALFLGSLGLLALAAAARMANHPGGPSIA